MKIRKKALTGGGFVAAVLVSASVAFACTTYRGTFTLTPDGVGATAVTAVGKNSGMNYCAGGTPATATVAAAQTGGFSVAVGLASTCLVGGTNQLGDGTYTVTFTPNALGSGVGDCMNPVAIQMGAPVTVSGGTTSGSAHFNLPPVAGGYQVCISDLGGGQGNQIPVTVA